MVKRACGDSRVENGLYAVVETSPYGKEIEYFCIDPSKPIDLKPFRSPILVNYHRLKTMACDDDSNVRVDYTKFR